MVINKLIKKIFKILLDLKSLYTKINYKNLIFYKKYSRYYWTDSNLICCYCEKIN